MNASAIEESLASAKAAQPLRIGARLSAARQANRLELFDVSLRLKLSVQQIEALENENWAALPQIAFVRGFVRNYARLLEIPSEPLMQELDTILGQPSVDKLEVPYPHRRPASVYGIQEKRGHQWLLPFAFFLMMLALLSYFFFAPQTAEWSENLQKKLGMMTSEEPENKGVGTPEEEPEPLFPPGTDLAPSSVDAPTPAPAVSSPAGKTTTPVPVSPTADVPAPAPVVSSPAEKATTPVPVVPPQTEAPVPTLAAEASLLASPPVVLPDKAKASGTSDQTLRLLTSGTCWVEVRSSDEKILLSRTLAAGEDIRLSIEGKGALVLGNAPAIQVFWRDKAIDLNSYRNSNSTVARLPLE